MGRPTVDISFAAGILVGAAIGTILGVLYAPKPGRETREDLRRKGREFGEGATSAVSKIRDAGNRVIRRTQETMGPENPGSPS